MLLKIVNLKRIEEGNWIFSSKHLESSYETGFDELLCQLF